MEPAFVEMRSCLMRAVCCRCLGIIITWQMLMRMSSTRNSPGRIAQTAYLSLHKPPQTLSQLFASEQMCINAYVMALSRNVRYQFVCQALCVSFVCWLVSCGPAVASRRDGKRPRAWTSASGPGVHRSSHLYTGVDKIYKSCGGSITVCPSHKR